MRILRYLAAAIAALTSAYVAAQATAPRATPPGFVKIVETLNLDGARAELVAAILENAHERMITAQQHIGPAVNDTARATLQAAVFAIRQDMHRQLASVLTPEELAELQDEGAPDAGPRWQRAVPWQGTRM